MFSWLRLVYAFARRDFLNAASYRLTFLFGVGSLLFYLLVFFFVGKIFSGAAPTYLARYGGEYFPFVLVGLALQTLVGAGMGGLSQVISQEQYFGTLEPILGRRGGGLKVLSAAALSRFVFSSGNLVLYLAGGVLIFGVRFRWEGLPLFAAVAALVAVAYFGLGMASAAFLLAFKQGNPVNFVFNQLGLILAGVYFPLEVLPRWLRAASTAFPMTYALEAARGALLGGAPAAAAGRPLLILAAFAVVAVAVGGWAFHAGLRRARRDGSLSWY